MLCGKARRGAARRRGEPQRAAWRNTGSARAAVRHGRGRGGATGGAHAIGEKFLIYKEMPMPLLPTRRRARPCSSPSGARVPLRPPLPPYLSLPHPPPSISRCTRSRRCAHGSDVRLTSGAAPLRSPRTSPASLLAPARLTPPCPPATAVSATHGAPQTELRSDALTDFVGTSPEVSETTDPFLRRAPLRISGPLVIHILGF